MYDIKILFFLEPNRIGSAEGWPLAAKGGWPREAGGPGGARCQWERGGGDGIGLVSRKGPAEERTGLLVRRETPSSKLLSWQRTDRKVGRKLADSDGQGSNRGVKRIWLHKCTGPRKSLDTVTEKTSAKPVSAAAEPPLGGQYIPLSLYRG